MRRGCILNEFTTEHHQRVEQKKYGLAISHYAVFKIEYLTIK